MDTMDATWMKRDARRGSALITAVIIVFVVTMLTGSFLYLASTEYRTASRTFLSGACFSLAEGGVDLAIDALNDNDTTDWSVSGTTWTRTISSGLSITDGAEGKINIVILDTTSISPIVYSEGVVTGHTVGDLSKQLKVVLEAGSISAGDGGHVSDKSVNNGNNVTYRQFDSRLGTPGATLADGSTNWSDNLMVATPTFTDGAINLGNADIIGYIATGGGAPRLGPNGGVYSLSNPGVHDPSRVTYDYYSNFPTPSAPADLPNYTSPPSISRGTNTLADGVYYLDGSSDSITTTNGKDLLVAAGTEVTLIMTGGAELKIGGDITVQTGGQLTVYTDGDVTMSGGINNDNATYDSANSIAPAERLQIYGTNTTDASQTIKLHGGPNITAFVYAPTANLELKGGGGGTTGYFNGALIVHDSVMTGNWEFLHDRALGDKELGNAGSYGVIEWLELNNETTETKRITMATYMP